MEDPWSSPWATDTPAPPTIDLPSEPQRAHFGNTPRKKSRSPSPWRLNTDNDQDDWGGWSEATVGKESPGWGRSPNLKPLGSSTGTGPEPWALPVADSRTEDRGTDSAISLDDEGRTVGLEHGKSGSAETDVWGKDHIEASRYDFMEKKDLSDMQIKSELGENSLDGTRQTSKVQELVGMYDDMARIASAEASSTETVKTEDNEATKTVDKIHDESEEALSSSLEKLQTVLPTTESKAEAVQGVSTGIQDEELDDGLRTRPITDDSEIPSGAVVLEREDEVPQQETDHGYEQSTAPSREAARDMQTQTFRSPTETAIPKPSTPYAIDFSNLDGLFPDTQTVTTTPEELPDFLIKESFNSVSQRKAWYRISRFGSMKKHNDGDDENYVRVSWNTSAVRKDTLSTVRRWMEEDSIGGRVMLGRRLGHGGGSMFNWDSEAPPVEIGELFARKRRKSKGHARHISAIVEGTIIPPAAASFGWSSSVPSSPVTGRFSSEWHTKPSRLSHLTDASTTSEATEVDDERIPKSFVNGPSLAQVDPPVLESVPQSQDEDDEWGEMVTTTVTPSAVVGANSLADARVPVSKTVVEDLSSGTIQEGSWGGLELLDSPMDRASQPSALTIDTTSASGSPAFIRKDPLPTPRSPQPLKDELAASPLQLSRPASMELASHSAQDDEIVAAILAGLPDLSYMLK